MSELFEGINTISLKNPYPNGTEIGEEVFGTFISVMKEIEWKLDNNERVYLGITSGDRKGSIGYIKEIEEDFEIPSISYQTNYWSGKRNTIYNLDHYGIHCILGWDKRRNKIKWSTYSETVYLPDYEGPTVWKKFDKKAAEKQLLKDEPVKDRYGNLLSVGDRVIYINARYGAGACLEKGIIAEIKGNVRLYGDHRVTEHRVYINNASGEKSKITKPELSIMKY